MAQKVGNASIRLDPPAGEPDLIQSWLEATLSDHGIVTENWGTGPFKTLKHLLNEITQGEIQLGVANNALLRIGTVLRIDVRYSGGGQELKLFEAEQIFTDKRRRERPTPYAIWEKIKVGENLEHAVDRAMCEELQIKGIIHSSFISRESIEEPPLDFPGLPSSLNAIDYMVNLTTEQFKAEGYEEKQPDKTTYFRWRTVEQTKPPEADARVL